MADYQVLSVHEAADALGVSMERVRQMIYAGQLAARRSSAGWLIPADAVAERSRNVYVGRPPEPQTAWSAIALLAAAAMDQASKPSPGDVVAVAEVVPDRKLRHRVLHLLASLPDPVIDARPWHRLLSARGRVRHLWVHPGVFDRLARDPKVSRGGEAVLSDQDGLTAQPGRLELYVSEADAEDLIRQYRMREDRDGQVRLVIMPSSIPSELAPGGGDPVAAPAAVSDLLEEDDPRARHAAAVQLHSYQAALRATGWLDHIDTGSSQPHKSHDKSRLAAKTEQAQSE